MPDSQAPVGINCKTFRNTSGNYSAPTWSVLDDINEESLQITYDEAQVDRRGAPVGESEPTVRRAELTLKVLKDTADPNWQALHGAFVAKTSIDIMALDSAAILANGTLDLGNTANVTGVRYTGKLFGFSEGRNLNDAVFNETTIKPCLNSQFKTVKVEGGIITYNVVSA